MDEVGVVGGGPGGAAAAFALARAGVAVTLFRPRRPGEKPCGGAVPDSFLPRIDGFAPPRAPFVRPARIVLENAAGSGSVVEVPGLRIFRRADLDAALQDAAAGAGARLVDGKVEAIAPERDGVVVTCARGERRRFTWLVGADGARGLSRRSLGLGPGEESVGLGATLEGPVPDRMVLCFPDRADAYCWIFPRPGGCAVGIAYDSARLAGGAAAAILDRFLDRHLDGGAAAMAGGHRYRYPIPVYGPGTGDALARAAGSRILLVGDAAGVADPLTREGIRYAIVCGRCAADCLIASRPDRYADRVASVLGPELSRARRAARLFYDEPVAQWMVPMTRVHPGIRAVLGDLLTCRQTYRGLRRRLLRAAVGLYACDAAAATPPTGASTGDVEAAFDASPTTQP